MVSTSFLRGHKKRRSLFLKFQNYNPVNSRNICVIITGINVKAKFNMVVDNTHIMKKTVITSFITHSPSRLT